MHADIYLNIEYNIQLIKKQTNEFRRRFNQVPHDPPFVMSQMSVDSTNTSPTCLLAVLYFTGVRGCPPRAPSG